MSVKERTPQGAARDPGTILVVDDEASMRDLLRMLLEGEGYDVVVAPDGKEAQRTFEESGGRIDLVIQDLKMPGMDGRELLAWIHSRAPDVPVVVITAFSTWDNAVEAMRLGAYDYIRKPFDTDAIRAVAARALERRAAERGVRADGDASSGRMIGNNPLVQDVMRLVKHVAPTDSTVLIQGESGTGKELVAKAIHSLSHRRDGAFVPVNCSAFTESLLESELFGHVRGAFTGAIESKEGLFRAASGGTLFLDEVADMSLTTQVKILRVLEERKVSPVGSTQLFPIDVRIIAATNKSMDEEVARRAFREDLFYRLNVIPVFLPPLRDRKDDIPLLTGHFLAKYSARLGKRVDSISDRGLRALHEYDWPGNVRELENIIQRHVALCEGTTIESIFLGKGPQRGQTRASASSGETVGLIPEGGIDLEQVLDDRERDYLREALRITEGSLINAAKLLGMSYRSLRYRVKKLRVRDDLKEDREASERVVVPLR
jgi:two-component system response regulator PilR (NtrC family)